MKAYLTYALNKEGDLVHIDSVPNGNRCECVCPHCKSELCAKNGGDSEKKVHHFAHLNGADCIGAIESALHKMAKNIMKETLCLQLPNRLDGSQGERLKLDHVEIEQYDKETHLRPDCIGYYGDKVIWIEFKRTHAVDARKKGKIISAKIDCIELDINTCKLDHEAVRKFITEDTGNRIWIRDTSFKPKRSKATEENSYYDRYEYRHIQRIFAKNEEGILVNLTDDDFNTNIHSYYCLACGKELIVDIDKSGNYIFTHIDKNIQCEDDLYLHEAAKEIIKHKFNKSKAFNIIVPQHHSCPQKANCAFHRPNSCFIDKGIEYELKQKGYIDCQSNYKLPDIKHKCDIVIIHRTSIKDSIIISINSGNCHIDVDTKKYRIIEIEIYNEYMLSLLLNNPIGKHFTQFINFKRNNGQTAQPSEINRKILKFYLFSSGKYYLDYITCDKIDESKHSSVLEMLFIEEVIDKQLAKLFSLMECYKLGKRVCLCEICCFIAKTGHSYGTSKTICKRYKTKNTPHFPLQITPIDCPHFKLDRQIENLENHFDGKVFIKEI